MGHTDSEITRGMRVLFLTRKTSHDIGGLSRFIHKLTKRIPSASTLCIKQPLTWRHFFQTFDLVHATDATLLPLAVLYKIIFRVPIIVTAHGKDITYPNFFYQFVLRVCILQADAIVLDSPYSKKLLKKFSLRKNRVRTIAPGISIDHYKKLQPFRLPWHPWSRVLITVGNLIPRKGQLWFIKNVMSKLPKRYVYAIVGNGPQQQEIEQTIEKLRLGERVFVFPDLDDNHVAYLLTKAEVFAVPNQRIRGDFEGFGIAAGEAARMGLPVIASNVDGLPSVIHNGKNGLVVKPTVVGFIQAIRSLTSAKTQKRLGQQSNIYTHKNFSWKRTTASYQALFRSFVRTHDEFVSPSGSS